MPPPVSKEPAPMEIEAMAESQPNDAVLSAEAVPSDESTEDTMVDLPASAAAPGLRETLDIGMEDRILKAPESNSESHTMEIDDQLADKDASESAKKIQVSSTDASKRMYDSACEKKILDPHPQSKSPTAPEVKEMQSIAAVEPKKSVSPKISPVAMRDTSKTGVPPQPCEGIPTEQDNHPLSNQKQFPSKIYGEKSIPTAHAQTYEQSSGINPGQAAPQDEESFSDNESFPAGIQEQDQSVKNHVPASIPKKDSSGQDNSLAAVIQGQCLSDKKDAAPAAIQKDLSHQDRLIAAVQEKDNSIESSASVAIPKESHSGTDSSLFTATQTKSLSNKDAPPSADHPDESQSPEYKSGSDTIHFQSQSARVGSGPVAILGTSGVSEKSANPSSHFQPTIALPDLLPASLSSQQTSEQLNPKADAADNVPPISSPSSGNESFGSSENA